MNAKLKHTLTGKFVHTFRDDEQIAKFPDWRLISKQGWIREPVKTDNFGIATAYLIQWFEWGMGQPSSQTIEIVETMMSENWSIYETEEQWRYQSDRQFELQKLDRHERTGQPS